MVILESTIPVGTTEKVGKWISNIRPDLCVGDQEGIDRSDRKIYISHCPERVLPGNILEEFISNDRIIGGINSESALISEKFYKNFVKGDIYLTDSRTAELAKLAENTFRDINIAYANTINYL